MSADITDSEGTPLHIILRHISAKLTPLYGAGEAKAMARIIFRNLKGWTPVDLAIRANEPVSDFIIGKINAVLERLARFEPIQYIFGNADFYGLNLRVTPDVLIPRPETAELVDIIVRENSAKDLRVIDFGTGSGCIAIALSRNLPFAQVTAVDISSGALQIASENASKLHAPISFIQADILSLSSPSSLSSSSTQSTLSSSQWDIIVSNPPYIAEKELATMHTNVLNFEPHTALFVPNDDPLRFYRAILQYALKALAPDGKIYFEINPIYANQLLDLAKSLGFSDTLLIRDTDARLRFLRALR